MCVYNHISFQQLWTVALCLTQPMAVLVPLEQHLDKMPPTVATLAIAWWETVLAHVKLVEIGLGVHLPVNVCCSEMLSSCVIASFITIS